MSGEARVPHGAGVIFCLFFYVTTWYQARFSHIARRSMLCLPELPIDPMDLLELFQGL
jgi:hypothetical protein